LVNYNALDTLTKPVYDVASYGEDLVIPLSTDTLALQAITWSGLNELLQVAPHHADSHLEDYPRLISSEDTLGILNEGDGVRYSRTFEFLTDMSAWVYKTTISICVGLAVTAYTSGNHSVDSVQFILSERLQDGSLVKEIENQTVATGMTNITSAVNAATIVQFESNVPFKITQGNVVRLEISFNSTDTATATSFEGIFPYFYFQEGSTAKTLTESSMLLHLHPALDHAFPVFRDSSIVNRIDFDGIDRSGNNRAAI